MPEQLAPPNPSELVATVSTVESLRATRHELAEAERDKSMRSAVGYMDQISDPSTYFAKVRKSNFRGSMGEISYGDLMAIEAMGQDTKMLTEQSDEYVEYQEAPAFTAQIDDETITAWKYGRGLEITFSTDREDKDQDGYIKPKAIREKISQRFMQSPGHVAMNKLNESVKKSTELQYPLTTEYFDPTVDRIGTLDLLQRAGFFGYRANYDLINSSVNVEDAILVEEGGLNVKEETETATTFTRREVGRSTTLIIDRATGQMALQFSPKDNYHYNEIANNSVFEESAPFIETKSAEELLGLLDSVGLMPHPDFQNEMINPGEANRYGSIYTRLSREIAKWVNRDARRQVGNLFVRYDPSTHATGKGEYGGYFVSEGLQRDKEYGMTPEEAEAEEALLTERLLSLDVSTASEPTQILIGLAQQTIRRDAVPSDEVKELPVTSSEISITDGACFDVAGYYIGAAGDRNGLNGVEENGVKLLEKTHGSHTFMLQEPTILNGVKLPKGTLMQRGKDGGWAMLRLTPFVFDNPEDQLATGSEMTKVYEHETRAIRRIGGVSLINLVEAAQ